LGICFSSFVFIVDLNLSQQTLAISLARRKQVGFTVAYFLSFYFGFAVDFNCPQKEATIKKFDDNDDE